VIEIDAAARRLWALREACQTIAALPDAERPRTLDEAYAVQDRVAELTGEATVAWKIGASSLGIQKRLGVSEPFSGRYQTPYAFEYPAVLGWERFATRPGVECEIGLRLGHDVLPADGPFDAESISGAVDAIVPTIELVCGRYDDPFSLEAPSLVADNGMAGYLVLGEPVPMAEAPDLARVQAVVRVNGDAVASGDLGSAEFDPFEMLAWLAGNLAERKIPLTAGTIVSTGSLTGVHFLRPTDGIVADLGPLGRVSVMVSD
jgi:2-keto-4-pentenoate hydratase